MERVEMKDNEKQPPNTFLYVRHGTKRYMLCYSPLIRPCLCLRFLLVVLGLFVLHVFFALLCLVVGWCYRSCLLGSGCFAAISLLGRMLCR
jgi:hypothetical protein